MFPACGAAQARKRAAVHRWSGIVRNAECSGPVGGSEFRAIPGLQRTTTCCAAPRRCGGSPGKRSTEASHHPAAETRAHGHATAETRAHRHGASEACAVFRGTMPVVVRGTTVVFGVTVRVG